MRVCEHANQTTSRGGRAQAAWKRESRQKRKKKATKVNYAGVCAALCC